MLGCGATPRTKQCSHMRSSVPTDEVYGAQQQSAKTQALRGAPQSCEHASVAVTQSRARNTSTLLHTQHRSVSRTRFGSGFGLVAGPAAHASGPCARMYPVATASDGSQPVPSTCVCAPRAAPSPPRQSVTPRGVCGAQFETACLAVHLCVAPCITTEPPVARAGGAGTGTGQNSRGRVVTARSPGSMSSADAKASAHLQAGAVSRAACVLRSPTPLTPVFSLGSQMPACSSRRPHGLPAGAARVKASSTQTCAAPVADPEDRD